MFCCIVSNDEICYAEGCFVVNSYSTCVFLKHISSVSNNSIAPYYHVPVSIYTKGLDTDAIIESGGLFQHLLSAAEFHPGKPYGSMVSLFAYEKKPLI